MLRKVKTQSSTAREARIAIVASEYNAEYVEAMLSAALRVLRAARVARVEVVRVPGAYEIPVAVQRLVRRATTPLSAIICLGVILRGQTAHAQLIG
jgi:6,7-dimethyl-8-ribityllumazine synthase